MFANSQQTFNPVLPPSSHLGVIGAGPVGLALALQAARTLPQARISLYDARPPERDIGADPRTLALSLGSIQLLRRLDCWPETQAEPIREVHVSQAPPTWGGFGGPADGTLRISAREEAVPMLGAVLRYGQLVAPLQAAWLAAAAAEPQRLHTRFGTPVQAVKPLAEGVEIDAGIVEACDLAVVAEGGVFAEQARKALAHDYRQRAWVGQVTFAPDAPGTDRRGVAFERFTRHGPVALLPLRPEPAPLGAAGGAAGATGGGPAPAPAGRRAALVWCVPSDDEDLLALDDAQRLAVLRTLLPAEAGQAVGLSPLKSFALGLNAERTLVQGRSVRIGNAAQTLHPVAGQGLNLGLRDAHELVRALAAARFGTAAGEAGRPAPGALDAALRRVEWRRAPDRWSMIAATDFLARSFTWQWPGLGLARGLGLGVLQLAGPLRSQLARRMMFGGR